MIQYLIVCPLVFIAGLVDSIAGGGGLIALPAYLIAGVPPHVALGTNKLSSSTGNVLYPLGLTAGVCSVTGHYIGSGMVAHDGHKVVRPVVLLVLAVLFIKILTEIVSGN